MKRVAIVISFIIVAAIFLFLPMYSVLSFTETRTTHPEKFYISINEDNHFQIRYTHSIHLTDVLEMYAITDTNDLKLVSMEYEDVAIGMPAFAEEGETLTYEDGRYILSFENRILPNFTLYVGDVDVDLYFLYDGDSYNLKDYLQRGKSYLFEVKKISLIEKWKGAVTIHGEKSRGEEY